MPWTKFDNDVASGMLATVTWMYAPSGPDEHPPYGKNAGTPVLRQGMEWTIARVNAIANSVFWNNVAIFITWDDWGGWYDHVEPVEVEKWNGDDPPHGPAYNGTQFRYGSRVPCLIISPYAKENYISKTFHSHVSLVKFCETTFGLPPINNRDANADDMSDSFDYTQPPQSPPPTSPGGISVQSSPRRASKTIVAHAKTRKRKK
jgi:phospholipase C